MKRIKGQNEFNKGKQTDTGKRVGKTRRTSQLRGRYKFCNLCGTEYVASRNDNGLCSRCKP